MAVNLDRSFDRLSNPDMWTDVAAVGAGYMGGSVAQTTLDGMTPFDVPNAAYGVVVAGAAAGMSFTYSNKVATGGALYALDAVAQRLELKQSVTSIGQGGN